MSAPPAGPGAAQPSLQDLASVAKQARSMALAMRKWPAPSFQLLKRVGIRVRHRHLAPAFGAWHEAVLALKEKERVSKQRRHREKVLAIVRHTPPGQRNLHQLEIMKEWACHTKSLGHLSDETYAALFQAVRHRIYSNGDIACLQGTVGNEYIVPMSGTLSLFAVDKRAEQRNIRDYPERRRRNCRREATQGTFGRFVANASLGEGFGEVALLEAQGKRSLSVVAMDDSEVLLLHRDEYSRLLQERHRKLQQVHNKVDFLRSLDLFADWPNTSLNRLAFTLKEQRYTRGQVIIRHMQDALNTIYIVRSGTCELRVLLDVEEDENHHMHIVKPGGDDGPLLKQEPKKDSSEGGDFAASQGRHPNMVHHKRKENVDVCLIGRGEVIGGGALLRGWNTQNALLLATNDVEVLKVRTHRFVHLASHRHSGQQATMHLLELQQAQRKDWQQLHFEKALSVRDAHAEEIAEKHGPMGVHARDFDVGCYQTEPLGLYGRKNGYTRKFMRAPCTPFEANLMNHRQQELRGQSKSAGSVTVKAGSPRKQAPSTRPKAKGKAKIVVHDTAPRRRRSSASRRPSSASRRPSSAPGNRRASFQLSMYVPATAMVASQKSALEGEIEDIVHHTTVAEVEQQQRETEAEAPTFAPHSHLATYGRDGGSPKRGRVRPQSAPRTPSAGPESRGETPTPADAGGEGETPKRKPRPTSATPYTLSKCLSSTLRQEQLLQPRSAAFGDKRKAANKLIIREHGALAALGPPDVEIKHPKSLSRPPTASLAVTSTSLTFVKVPKLKPRPYSASANVAAAKKRLQRPGSAAASAVSPVPGASPPPQARVAMHSVFLESVQQAKAEWKLKEAALWRDAYRPAGARGDPSGLSALEARAMIECGGMLKGKLRVKPKHMRVQLKKY